MEVERLGVLSEGRTHRSFGHGVALGVALAGAAYLVGLAVYLIVWAL